MKLNKGADVGQSLTVGEEELKHINAMSRKELKAEEVYAFCVRLCDNEVDRDGERFPAETLRELAGLFVGKSGIFDHQWSAREQVARIYRTELVQDESAVTAVGEPYCYLKGYAYMMRTEKNADLIAEIEGGIKKEVSVGCAVTEKRCSICGGDRAGDGCGHVNGRRYGGKLCCTELVGATDAYEWSFVAVPAQVNAGVIKTAGTGDQARLEREAAMGRRYLKKLREDVVRLGGLAEPELDQGTMKSIAERLEERELLSLKEAYEQRVAERYPVQPQLPGGREFRENEQSDRAFLI